MSFKTVLTITGPDMGDGDLQIAARLCEEVSAHLAVLVVVLAAPPPVGEYAELSGSVASEIVRDAICVAAQNAPGAKQVIDRLSVVPRASGSKGQT